MLDWQLFLSAENFAAAWAKVRSNHGCAGSDGETIDQFDRHAESNGQGKPMCRKISSKAWF
jgi:CRISP-associated protein Cas1